MKTRIITAIVFFNVGILWAQNINPAWQFVGPKTYYQQGVTDLFRAGQIDDITVDPGVGNENHIIVSSFYAGIWETYNVFDPQVGWDILPNFDNPLPDGIGCNGISAVAFRNHTELYAANYFERGHYSYSNRVLKYDYSTLSWTEKGTATLPFKNDKDVIINRIVFMPNQPDHVFLCTSKGLVKSTDAGDTWSAVSGVSGWIHSIAFIEQATSGSYFWYIAGWDNTGSAILMESNNGAAFTNMMTWSSMSTYTSVIAAYPNSGAGICLGNQSAANGDRDIFICTAVSNNNWGCGGNNCSDSDRLLHRFTRNISNGSINVSATLTSTGGEFTNGPTRMVIGYDKAQDHVLLGGVNLTDFDVANNISKKYNSITEIHDDHHGIYINTSVTPNQIFIGGDGGFYSLDYATGPFYTPSPLNYGLDISLINGFSGASESNKYVFGQQDHLYSALYNETAGKVTAVIAYPNIPEIGENDGGLIDKFDDNRLVIGDNSSYNSSYYVADIDLSNFANGAANSMYEPKASPSYYFEPETTLAVDPVQTFGLHPFFQQPFRKDRIYTAGRSGQIFQFDPISNFFVAKVRLNEYFTQFTYSATLKSEYCPGCTQIPDPSVLSTPYLRLHCLSFQNQPSAMSFSQLDKNTMYIVTNNNDDPCCYTASQVVHYIGNNLDDIRWNHNEWRYDNAPFDPQWQLITPDWLSAPFTTATYTISEIEAYHIRFTGVETSNWNKDKIYVSCSSNIFSTPPFPYRVITYDPATLTWDDYSDGIPDGESVVSMIMDHASNDGIYVSTEKNVYYREAGMAAWVSYNTGASGDIMPYVGSRQMEINYKENTVRAGTYGRGIWKSNLVCPSDPTLVIPSAPISGYNEADVISTTSGTLGSTPTAAAASTVFRATNKVTLEPGFMADATGGANYFAAFIHGCADGSSTSSYNYFRTNFDFGQTEVINGSENDGDNKKLIVFPNPTNAKFSIKISGDKPNKILVYNSFGQVILNQLIKTESQEIDLTKQPDGIYFIKVFAKDNTYTSKIIKR